MNMNRSCRLPRVYMDWQAALVLLVILVALLPIPLVYGQNQWDVRLINDGSPSRVVEVYNNNKWWTLVVGSPNNNLMTGQVICGQLGYVPNTASWSGPKPDQTKPDQLMHLCVATDKTLKDCSLTPKSPNFQSPDLRIQCLGNIPGTTAKPDLSELPPVECNNASSVIRLEGGTSTEGRVMVKYNNTWGAICDDLWGTNDAKVVCRMLCTNDTQAVALTNKYNKGVSKIWLTNLECLGNETSLTDCQRSGWGAHKCLQTEVASVQCAVPPTIPPEYPQPDITCTVSSIIATFNMIHHPNTKPEHFVLKNTPDAGCGFKAEWKSSKNESIVVTVPFSSKCKTERQITGNQVIYNNTIIQKTPPPSGPIQRVQPEYHVPVSCGTPRTVTIPPKPMKPSVIVVPPKEGGFKFDMDMNYFDWKTKTKLKEPVTVKLGDKIRVNVDLTTADPNLKLIVDECYAQPGNKPNEKYILFKDKCSNDGTVEFTPINQTTFSFGFQTFQFKNFPNLEVTIHCTAYVCAKTDKSAQCDQSCLKKTRRRRNVNDHGESVTKMDVTTSGLKIVKPQGDDWEIIETGIIIRYRKVTKPSTVPTQSYAVPPVPKATKPIIDVPMGPKTKPVDHIPDKQVAMAGASNLGNSFLLLLPSLVTMATVCIMR